MAPIAARRAPRFRMGVEALETRQVLSAMLGITSQNALVSFDSSRPDLIRSSLAISGLKAGESILAIDSRVATGQVYGLGSTGRVYTLDPNSGAASLVGAGPIPSPLSGTNFNIDFNGGGSTLRITSNTGQDLRFDVDTNVLTIDPALVYSPSDPGSGMNAQIVGAAYNNNLPNSTATTLFEIDAARDALVTQEISYNSAHAEQTTGQLHTFASLGFNVSGSVGLEITPEGTMLLSVTPTGGSVSSLYQFASTGTLTPITLVGSFPSGVSIRDITAQPVPKIVFAVTAANTLISFDSNTPGDLLSNHAIMGLQPGESIAAIAFRPSTGVLYGFGSTGRLYAINSNTGVANSVSSSPISPAYDHSKPSIDFLTGSDQIHFVTKLGQNLRIDPDLGVVVEVDNPLTYAAGDPSLGFSPAVVTESQALTPLGSNTTSLFGIDSARDSLVIQDTSPLSGTITTAGPLGVAITDDAGMDSGLFTGGTSITLASLTESGGNSSTLYRINPRLGISLMPISLVPIGTIGGGLVVRDIALAPSGNVGFSATSYAVAESAGSALITVTRTGGSNGPLQVRALSSDGTAQAGINYTPVNVLLSFGDGETTKTFTVPITAGSFSTGTRTVILSLVAASTNQTLATSTLTIQATPQSTPLAITSIDFEGTARKVDSFVLNFNQSIDVFKAGTVSNYRITGVTSARKPKTVTLSLQQLGIDPPPPGSGTTTGFLLLASPIALSQFRSLQITAIGFGPNGSDLVVNFAIKRGTVVTYTDADGDRVALGAAGRGSRIVVVQRLSDSSVTAFVEGHAKVVTGLVIPRRGSNHTTVINRFVTGGARLKLAKSITVKKIG